MENKAIAISQMRLHDPIDGSQHFRVVDGRTLCGLKDLALVMEHLADEVFHHHVSGDKNDFANWVRDVIHDEALAQEMMQSLDKDGHQKIIFRHIVRNYVA